MVPSFDLLLLPTVGWLLPAPLLPLLLPQHAEVAMSQQCHCLIQVSLQHLQPAVACHVAGLAQVVERLSCPPGSAGAGIEQALLVVWIIPADNDIDITKHQHMITGLAAQVLGG